MRCHKAMIWTLFALAALILLPIGVLVGLGVISFKADLPLDQELFNALKEDRVERILPLLPDSEELFAIYELVTTRFAPVDMPRLLQRDGGFLYNKSDAKETAREMRQILREDFAAVRRFCEQQGFSWADARLEQSLYRRRIFSEDTVAFAPKEDELGKWGGKWNGLLILRVSDGDTEVSLCFRIFRATMIDCGITIDKPLTREEREPLVPLADWGHGGVRAPDDVAAALRVLLRHPVRKFDLLELLWGTRPTDQSVETNKWKYESSQTDRPSKSTSMTMASSSPPSWGGEEVAVEKK